MGVLQSNTDSAELPAGCDTKELPPSIAEATAQAGRLSISDSSAAEDVKLEQEPSNTLSPPCSDIEDIAAAAPVGVTSTLYPAQVDPTHQVGRAPAHLS